MSSASTLKQKHVNPPSAICHPTLFKKPRILDANLLSTLIHCTEAQKRAEPSQLVKKLCDEGIQCCTYAEVMAYMNMADSEMNVKDARYQRAMTLIKTTSIDCINYKQQIVLTELKRIGCYYDDKDLMILTADCQKETTLGKNFNVHRALLELHPDLALYILDIM